MKSITEQKKADIEADLIKKRELAQKRFAVSKEIQRVKRLARDEVTRLETIEADCRDKIKELTIVGISVKHEVARASVDRINAKFLDREPDKIA
mgnify:FL=1